MYSPTFPRLLGAVAIAAAFSLSPLAVPPAAAAMDVPKLAITPVDQKGPFFDLTATPGENRQLIVEIGNVGREQVSARTYAADVYTINNGGFGARLHDEPVTGDARWLEYPPGVVELLPGRALRRTFTLRVPGDARPGEHIASLVVENADPIQGSGSVTLNQVLRQAVAVVVTVPGPKTARLTIGPVRHGVSANHSVISIAVANEGNTRLRPVGEIVVRTTGGAVVSRTPITMDSFYAGTQAVVEARQRAILDAGRYRIDAILDYGEGLRAEVRGLEIDVPAIEAERVIGPPDEQSASPPQGFRAGWPILVVGFGLVVSGAVGAVVVSSALRRRRSTAAPETNRS